MRSIEVGRETLELVEKINAAIGLRGTPTAAEIARRVNALCLLASTLYAAHRGVDAGPEEILRSVRPMTAAMTDYWKHKG